MADITGLGSVNSRSRLLCIPLTVTDTLPVAELDGTVATICESLQLTTLRMILLTLFINSTVLEPFVLWKPEPFTVICVPTIPLAGEILVICGGGTVKLMLVLLETPPEITTTEPEMAVVGTVATIWLSNQLTIFAARLENVTELPLPCVAPKPLPLICTWVPTGALDGESELTIGFGMLKTTSTLLPPAKLLTVTGPVVAVPGTVATICVSLQLTTVAERPLK